MQLYISELADYISVLEQAAYQAHSPKDWGICQEHLASAALIFAAIVKGRSNLKLEELVTNERRSFGWDRLGGAPGVAAESVFHIFASMVEDNLTQHSQVLHLEEVYPPKK